MGYTTEFQGEVAIDPPLNEHEISFLKDFAGSRRMNRTRGPLYAYPGGEFGQQRDDDILNYNEPHPDQPGLWCQWVPNDTGDWLEWDGGEKFYQSAEWMKYLITRLLAPEAREYVDAHIHEDKRLKHFTCDHVCEGEIFAQGEESDDRWMLVVKDNVVKVGETEVTYKDAEPI